jgi:hypothetical protein
MQVECKRVFILGGGFSYYAGLPLTSGFARALIAASDRETGRSGILVHHLSKFVRSTFGCKSGSSEDWPSLEDLFTCIDLAANSGHHLGEGYSAAYLRTVRRCLIARIIRMLDNRLDKATHKKGEKWEMLKSFLCSVDYASSAFLSMNWDEVVERRFRIIHPGKVTLDYGCEAIPVIRSAEGRQIIAAEPNGGPTLRIAKIHGSVNWLYCDNCQRAFWLQPSQGRHVSNQLLSAVEWRRLGPKRGHGTKPWTCPFCRKVPLSTRLATFSYRKALDFPMFQKSWSTAEGLLRNADTWAFIGYSLPAADYEFKYLLKRIQLSRQPRPRVVLVTGGDDAEATYKNYQRFFGEELRVGKNCFLQGLDKKSTECLLAY